MPRRAPTVDRIAWEMSPQAAEPLSSQPTIEVEGSAALAAHAAYDSCALEKNRAIPSGTMMTLAKRTMAFSAFMISELTFLTYFASLLMRAT